MGTWPRNKKIDHSRYLKEQQQVGEKVSHKVTIGLSLYISKTNSQLAMPDQIMFKLCMRRMRLRGAGPPTVARTVFGICHPSAALSRKIPHRVDHMKSISRRKAINCLFVFVDTLNYA